MHILDIIFPKRCVGCRKLGKYICDRCVKRIQGIDMPICPVCEKSAIDGFTHPRCRTRYTPDGLTSFYRYAGSARQAIKELKYRFISDLASEFVSLIPQEFLTTLVETFGEPTFLVPIPLHEARKKFRGFNQAEVLGALVARRLRIPLRADILLRTHETIPQVAMKKKSDRLKNMEQVFATRKTHGVLAGADILLFDDVFTTGATMRSAANTLKRAGARRVWAVTMAR